MSKDTNWCVNAQILEATLIDLRFILCVSAMFLTLIKNYQDSVPSWFSWQWPDAHSRLSSYVWLRLENVMKWSHKCNWCYWASYNLPNYGVLFGMVYLTALVGSSRHRFTIIQRNYFIKDILPNICLKANCTVVSSSNDIYI